ncbi:MAG: FAD-dependent oxidoreductase [Bacteriovoracaceae bacterium]
MERRDLLKFATSSALFYVSGCANGKFFGGVKNTPTSFLSAEELARYSPMNRLRDSEKVNGFTGDDPHTAHQILWDKETFITSKGGLPDEIEDASVVIIGGGISGLIAAHELAHLNPILLEQANRFGGNSKGETWEGLDYSLGAAYLTRPYPETRLDHFLKDVGANEIMRVKSDENGVIFQKKIIEHFWQGETLTKKSDKEALQKLSRYFDNMFKGENGIVFPDVPIENENLRDYINTLDNLSFHEHISAVLGGVLHPHIETLLEYYCWSSFGGSAKEISAATALNFFVGEMGEVLVPRGGNAGVAEKVFLSLSSKVPAKNLRPNSLVFDVNHKENNVEISYVDEKEVVKTIRAKYVIMACPKFVVGKILNNIEDERLNLINHLKYRSYLVANILLKKPNKLPYYDLFLMGDGKAKKVKEARATDVVIANFADQDSDNTVLTLYRSFPHENARKALLHEGAHDKYLQEFKNQFAEFREVLGFKEEDVLEFRLTRWGHPIPLSEKGLIANGAIEKLIAPFGERVFFADQDNWMLPCFETCAFEAFRVADIIKEKMRFNV